MSKDNEKILAQILDTLSNNELPGLGLTATGLSTLGIAVTDSPPPSEPSSDLQTLPPSPVLQVLLSDRPTDQVVESDGYFDSFTLQVEDLNGTTTDVLVHVNQSVLTEAFVGDYELNNRVLIQILQTLVEEERIACYTDAECETLIKDISALDDSSVIFTVDGSLANPELAGMVATTLQTIPYSYPETECQPSQVDQGFEFTFLFWIALILISIGITQIVLVRIKRKIIEPRKKKKKKTRRKPPLKKPQHLPVTELPEHETETHESDASDSEDDNEEPELEKTQALEETLPPQVEFDDVIIYFGSEQRVLRDLTNDQLIEAVIEVLNLEQPKMENGLARSLTIEVIPILLHLYHGNEFDIPPHTQKRLFLQHQIHNGSNKPILIYQPSQCPDIQITFTRFNLDGALSVQIEKRKVIIV